MEMHTEKYKFVALADAMKPGEQRRFSTVLLKAVFSDRLAIDRTVHETPGKAFLASLIGGRDGHYGLSEDRRGYVLSREAQPHWQDRAE